MGHAELGSEAGSLLLHVFNEFGALDAVRPAGEVFDEGGDGELAAGLVTFEDEGLEVGTGGIDGGGEAGAAGAEDDCIANGGVGHICLIVLVEKGFKGGKAGNREWGIGSRKSGLLPISWLLLPAFA